jgi:signal transduction histidine kinase
LDQISDLMTIRSDENRFKQILINLISNAIKFTFLGYVSISVEMTVHEDTGVRYLKVEVEDTGLGIKEEDMPHLFNMFGKLETHQHVNKTGCGLGLTISQALSRELGGTIEVDSVFGTGSKFRFYIKDETEASEKFVRIEFNKSSSDSNPFNFSSNKLKAKQIKLLQRKESARLYRANSLND